MKKRMYPNLRFWRFCFKTAEIIRLQIIGLQVANYGLSSKEYILFSYKYFIICNLQPNYLQPNYLCSFTMVFKGSSQGWSFSLYIWIIQLPKPIPPPNSCQVHYGTRWSPWELIMLTGIPGVIFLVHMHLNESSKNLPNTYYVPIIGAFYKGVP